MSLLDLLLGPPRPALNPEARSGWGVMLGGGATSAGVRVTPDNALKTAAVLACVRVLAEGIASLPWHVYERLPGGRKSLADGHLLGAMLRRPNGWQTPFEFREFMGVCLGLRGNFYALIRPGTQGAVTELWPLHPDRVTPKPLPSKRIQYRVKDESGVETPYTQDEVFHVRWMTLDGVVGVSPITYAANAIGLSVAAETHGAAFYRNGARPGVVLETEQKITEDKAKETLRGWNEMHAGAANSHRTAILPFGLKAHELGLKNTDAQFLETRRFQIEEIARIYRVPPHMIGDLSRSTNNNITQQSLEFLTFTLLPWLIRIEQAADRDLLMNDERHYVKFNIEGFKRGDAASRAAFYREMVNCGIFSLNECRELEDMDPVEGGDVHLVQGAMTTLDRVINPPEPAAPPAPPRRSEGETEDETESELRRTSEALRHALETFDVMLSGEQRRRRAVARRLRESRTASESQRLAAAEAERSLVAERGVVADLRERLEAGEIEAADLRRQLAESANRIRALDDGIAAKVAECQAVAKRAGELSERTDAAVRASLTLIEQTAEAMLKLEGDAIRKATRRANFLEEIDELRAKQAERMLRALEPATAVLAATCDRTYDLAAAVDAYVARSHGDLLDAAGAVTTAEQLTAAVERTLSLWQARPAGFVQSLLATEKPRDADADENHD